MSSQVDVGSTELWNLRYTQAKPSWTEQRRSAGDMPLKPRPPTTGAEIAMALSCGPGTVPSAATAGWAAHAQGCEPPARAPGQMTP